MFVLYNVAHENARIKSFDGNAWIRVIGFFITRKGAMEHSEKISSVTPGGMEIRIAPIGVFRLILNKNYSSFTEDDKEREEKKHNFLLKYHKENKEKNKSEVENNAANKKLGDIVFSPKERREFYKEITNEANTITTNTTNVVTNNYAIDSKLQLFPKDFQIRSQNYFAMAYVPDYESLIFESHDLDVWKIEYEDEKTRLRNHELKKLLIKHPHLKLDEIKKELDQVKNEKENYSGLFLKKFEEDLKIKYEKSIWDLCGESYVEMTQKIDEELQIWSKYNPVPETIRKEEPMIAFLNCGDSSEDVHSYILKNKKEELIKDYDVACINMYEWVRLSNFKNPMIKKEYREEIISNIFKNRDDQCREIERLQKNNPSIHVTEIEA